MSFVIIVVAVSSIIGFVTCQDFPVDPTLGNIYMPLIDAMTHLDNCGYIQLDPSKVGGDLDMEETRDAITNYQKFYGLPLTHVIDRVTLDHMDNPRCGCMDPVDLMVEQWNPEDLRYVTAGGKWNKTKLSYRVTRIPSTLQKRSVRRLARKAFKLWSETTSLEFIEAKKSDEVDIMIQFAKGFHNGPHNFYGQLDEIAHAFPPVPKEDGYSHLAGHVHLDASEDWVTDEGHDTGNTSFALLPVLLHEIGHALGLSHSTNPESVMTPLVTHLKAGNKVELTQDDIDGIRSLYGPRLPGHIVQKPCLDIDPPYDAIALLFGEIYVFKGDRYWRLISPGDISPTSGVEGELMITKWKGVPSNIDAVYQSTKTWDVVFVKGDSFWVYAGVENHPLIPGYPKPLRMLTLPDGLDAAVHTGKPPTNTGNSKPLRVLTLPDGLDAAVYTGDATYFMKARSTWKMAEDTTGPDLGAVTPHITEDNHWRNLPRSIDTAFFYDGTMYFVEGDSYYYAQAGKRKLHQGESFRQDFLGCFAP